MAVPDGRDVRYLTHIVTVRKKSNPNPKGKPSVKTYKLGSSSMIYSPGIVAWAINGAKFKKDRPKMIRIVSDGWGVPYSDAEALLIGKVPYTIEDDVVVFSVPTKKAA